MTDADPRGGRKDDQSLGGQLNELVSLVLAYAKQETLDPLKSLGRYIVWGVLGAVFFASGGALLTLTAVRVVQSETGHHLRGNLSWVPYFGGVLVAGIGAGWAAVRVIKGDRALKGGQG